MTNYHNIVALKCTVPISEILPSLNPVVIDESLFACKSALNEMKRSKLKLQFDSPEEEINYYKILKPRLLSRVLFFRNVKRILHDLPLGGKEIQLAYYHQESENLTHFCNTHKTFIAYCRTGDNYLDTFYFTREGAAKNPPSCFINLEPDFYYSIGYDNLLSVYLAYEKLEEFIQSQVEVILNPDSVKTAQKRLTWNESKVAMVELVYALHANGSIKGDIKQIMEVFSDLFSLDVGDYYRSFLEVKTRKSSYTKLLDSMAASLVKRIEDGDEI